jgi:hypothetical protein
MPEFEDDGRRRILTAVLLNFVTVDDATGIVRECVQPNKEAWAKFGCYTRRKSVNIITNGEEWVQIRRTSRGEIETIPSITLTLEDKSYLQGLIAKSSL